MLRNTRWARWTFDTIWGTTRLGKFGLLECHLAKDFFLSVVFQDFLMVNPCFRILMVNPYFPRNLVIYSDGLMRLMVYQCLLCFGCLLLGFAECLGEPEVFKSKSIARGWASCWADQAFALCRWNSMDLKMRRYEILRCKSFSKRFWGESFIRSWRVAL